MCICYACRTQRRRRRKRDNTSTSAPPLIQIDDLNIATLLIEKEVAGARQKLTLHGGKQPGQPYIAELRTVEGPPTSITLHFDTATGTAMKLNLEEASGGIIGNLLGLHVQKQLTAQADFALSADNRWNASLCSLLDDDPLVSAKANGQMQDNRWHGDALQITTPYGMASGQDYHLDLAKKDYRLPLAITIPDLASLNTLTGQKLQGAVNGAVLLDGKENAIAIDARLNSDAVTAADTVYEKPALQAHADLDPKDSSIKAQGGGQLSVQGKPVTFFFPRAKGWRYP